jgi:hypothetical protein
VRKIKLLIDTEANKMKVNTGKNGIDPPMPSIFAKYYVEGNLNDPTDAASNAKTELDRFTPAEQTRQTRLVPRRCVRGGRLNASKWAELYDALDLAISHLPQLRATPVSAASPPSTEEPPKDETDLYEWENARYKKVPYRLADRNRRRR